MVDFMVFFSGPFSTSMLVPGSLHLPGATTGVQPGGKLACTWFIELSQVLARFLPLLELLVKPILIRSNDVYFKQRWQ